MRALFCAVPFDRCGVAVETLVSGNARIASAYRSEDEASGDDRFSSGRRGRVFMASVRCRSAGQHASYLYKQLSDYKSGRRKNAIMNGIAATLSEPDMRNLAAYFSAQKAAGGGAKDTELIAMGQKLYRGGVSSIGVPACAGCHAPDGAGIPAQYPRIAGQHPEYTRAQLQYFRSAERDNDPNQMMRAITHRLTDKEVAALAEYIAGLR